MRKLKHSISTKEFDRKFESNEDITEYLDTSKAKATKHFHRINIDFPETFIKKIDEEAKKIGVARTAIIKVWIAERIQSIQ